MEFGLTWAKQISVQESIALLIRLTSLTVGTLTQSAFLSVDLSDPGADTCFEGYSASF